MNDIFDVFRFLERDLEGGAGARRRVHGDRPARAARRVLQAGAAGQEGLEPGAPPNRPTGRHRMMNLKRMILAARLGRLARPCVEAAAWFLFVALAVWFCRLGGPGGVVVVRGGEASACPALARAGLGPHFSSPTGTLTFTASYSSSAFAPMRHHTRVPERGAIGPGLLFAEILRRRPGPGRRGAGDGGGRISPITDEGPLPPAPSPQYAFPPGAVRVFLASSRTAPPLARRTGTRGGEGRPAGAARRVSLKQPVSTRGETARSAETRPGGGAAALVFGR